MRFIEITVLPNGETKLETKGFAGDACREASRFLETALGKTSSETLTSEYHDVKTNNMTQLNLEDRPNE